MILKFKKEIYRTVELLKEFGISKATFFRWQSKWRAEGRDVSEMGKFHLKGSVRTYWLVRKFAAWLLAHKVKEKIVFEEDVKDMREANRVLLNLGDKKYEEEN
tara:strand:- start:29 stop:337 length:309 start_codon:yes stop_codon:yes gene_type:complete